MFIPRQLQTKSSKQPPKSLPSLAPSTEQPLKDEKIDPILAKETVMSLEMLFSDYGVENGPPGWYLERMRSVEGENDCGLRSIFCDCSLLIRKRYPFVGALGFPTTRSYQTTAITS
jgi:hypothetical protein